MRRALVVLLLAVAVTGAVVRAVAATSVPLHYTTQDGGPRLVIRGAGCLTTEDSTRLRLVSYEPDRIVFRCVMP